ncbi:rabenosyn-5-like protein [Dinothrombium tinctorium]|uniref:Rabenosyn-5-like protein n=1 Tax=Dinothrombium tinctorium TaxID=1965070 RepID=A0A443REC6_9ACAR|nr:rabenosyn-5-like protein [Dinothrombium tinctorium]
MANPFDDDLIVEQVDKEQAMVKEGFLCPDCMTDFKTILRLQDHFAAVHTNDDRETTKKLSSQLKGFIGKARKMLNKADTFEDISTLDSSSALAIREPFFYHIWRTNQSIGPTNSFFEYFKQVRDSRIERYVIETNKLLIRLDKLMKDAPNDPEKRKQHEKSVVDWVNDADVKLCPSCAKSFNISRRRHHCRLCGGIMCHSCSMFLDFDYASKLISPTNLQSVSLLPSSSRNPDSNMAGLPRRGSNSSLMSMVNSAGEPHIRVCCDCKILLDRRNQLVEDQFAKPIITQLYEKLKSFIADGNKLIPLYCQMCSSLSQGESNYKLRDAQDLRIKLMRIAENIDVVSRKISNIDIQNEPPPHPSQLKLQRNIRLSATQYLRENMVGLPSLPTEEELQKLQEKRRQEIQKRIEEERKLALEEAEALRSQSSSSSSPSSKLDPKNLTQVSSASSFELVSPDTGWGPEFSLKPDCDLNAIDPMLVQISIIKNYIKKAREEHKYDEVAILELNLKELEINYMLEKQNQS